MYINQHQSKPRRPRLKVRSACIACRSKKAKCDGTRPGCARPRIQGRHAIYSPVTPHGHELAPSSRESPHTPPTSLDSFTESGEGTDPDADQNQTYYSSHGRFAGQVVITIDPAAGSHRVPFVDAPLFEDLILDPPSNSLRSHFIAELPPRAYADQLVDVYWRYVEPVEPVLDYQHFIKTYENIYSTLDRPPCTHSNLRLCILNAVFALAVQRQEYIPPQQRNEQGNRFFKRAWALLPADILWIPTSLELLQSLILVNRYLHCTDNQQKTWMSAGVAIRMAQSMCGHRGDSKDEALKLKVWASCVALDRCTSWSLGKSSTLVPIPLPPNSSQRSGSHAKPDRNSWGLRLYEIGNQIQLAQLRSRSTESSQAQQDDYCSAALQLEASLQQLEASLPPEWQARNLKMVTDRSSRAEGYLLHLRYLHHRIFLYRPMLAHLYFKTSSTSNAASSPHPSPRLQKAATLCLEAAQQITTLVIETIEPDQPIGLLPWWYRLYFLHMAGANFLAAMIHPELFSESIAESWEAVLLALRGHRHLCAYAAQCVWTFEGLASRIKGRWAGPVGVGVGGGVGASICESKSSVSAEESPPGISFDDLFQDIDFEIDSFLFGSEFAEGLL